MKAAHFGQCLCCIDIDKNNYPEETELDTNPSLTPARTLTLHTGEPNFGNLTYSQSCYDIYQPFAHIFLKCGFEPLLWDTWYKT